MIIWTAWSLFSIFNTAQWPRPSAGFLTLWLPLWNLLCTHYFALSGMHNTYLYVCFWLSLSTLCLSFLHPWHCSLPLLTRYSGEPGRKGAPALHNDHPADQPARAAPGCPRRTEEARRLTNGETEAANGVSSSAAGAGNCSQFFFSHI